MALPEDGVVPEPAAAAVKRLTGLLNKGAIAVLSDVRMKGRAVHAVY